MEDKTKQCDDKNHRINELENELSAIRLVYKIKDADFERVLNSGILALKGVSEILEEDGDGEIW